MNLSKNFTLEEFYTSETAARKGIENKPTPEVIRNLRALCENVLQPLRDKIGRPIVVTSGYRCTELNKAIKGAKNSQHTEGKAVDFHIPGLRLSEVFDICKSLPYDQLIQEFGRWIHVSYSEGNNRKERLIAKLADGKTTYSRTYK